MLFFIGILVLNVLISIWNCYAVGTAWKDTMAMGGWFNKLLLWSGVIQSGVGFSMPILLTLSWGSISYLTSGVKPTLSPEEGQAVMTTIFNLWYVAIIFPILGSGLAIWAHSLREAYRRRDFSSIATAGWNTFAQIHNTVSAVENLGGVFGQLGGFFGKIVKAEKDDSDDIKSKLVVLVVMLVVLSLFGGFMITFALVKYFAVNSESRLEQYARARA